MTKTLAAGAYFGRVAARREFDGLHISEHVYAPDLVVPTHAHERPYVCLVVAGGYVERIGRRTRQCLSSTLLVHPAGEEHGETFAPHGARILHVELPSRIAEAVPLREAGFAGGPPSLLARRIHHELQDWDSVSPLVVEGLTLQLLGTLGRAARPRGAPPWLARTLDLLRARFSEPLTLATVAREVGVDPAHLARTFRAHQRCTIGEYLRQLRVEYCCRALLTTDAPIAEIAIDAGFADQAHMTRVFRRIVGTTPARFRA